MQQRGILLRVFCYFYFDVRNRWYAPAFVSRSRITKEEKEKNTSENNSWSSVLDNLSCHFSLCNLEAAKS